MSETMHVFCCVIPTVISIVSLLTGAVGAAALMPAGILVLHEFMHHYEVPMIIVSGGLLILGWVLQGISYRIDCHSTGCGHGPCKPKKNMSVYVLIGATILFIFNTAIYLLFHTHLS